MKKRLMASILTVVMILTMLPVSALADGADTKPVEGVVTAHKDLVRDESGAPIVDEDGNYIVELSVQGNPYQIATQSEADVVLVIDNSGSMEEGAATETCGSTSFSWKRNGGLFRRWVCDECGAEYGYNYFDKPKVCTAQIQTEPRIETAKAVAKEFAQNILSGNSGNRLAVIGFAHKVYGKPAVRVSQGLTDSLTKVKSAINKMVANGGTDYTSALKQAQTWLNARKDKTRPAYVIFISDGAPGEYGNSIGDKDWDGSVQAAELETAKVNLYTIGISLSDTESAYLKKMATDANHYINVNGANYKTQLKNILKLWAEEINTIPAGTKAVLTDVVNIESFELVSYDDTLTLAQDGKTLTWNIGNIPSEEATVQFKVKPLEGVYGVNIPTNDDVFLDYQNGKTEKPCHIAKEQIGDPTVTIEQKITASFTLPNDVAWADGTEGWKAKQFVVYSTSASATNNVPSVEEIDVPEGKVFSHWEANVDSSFTLSATDTISFDSLKDHVTFDNNEAYIGFTAVFEDEPPAAEQKIVVNFSIFEGSWTNGVPAANSKTFTLSSTTPEALLTSPEVEAPAGKTFVEWQNNLNIATYTLADQAEFSYTSVMNAAGRHLTFDENGVAYIGFTAVFEDAPEEPENKTLKIYWAIDNPAGAAWTAYGNSEAWTETVAWSDKDNTFALPGLEVKEGYKLAGWSVSGKESNYWDAETTTFGLTGLIVEDENGGYVSITANIVADTPEEPENKTLKIYWAIDNPAGAAWTAYGNSEAWTETVAWSDKDNTFVLPGLEVKEGYKLAGWSVSGKESNYWDAETTTFGLTGLIVEDENGGYVSITANIVADTPEEPENKTLKIYWAIDNPAGAAWTAYGNSEAWTETVAWSDKDNTFVLPGLEVKEGYKLAGWSVSGKESNYWDAETTTFGLTGLIVEDENGGYVSITANIVADTPEEPENKTLKIYWAIDNPAGAAWTAYGNSEAWTETVAWSDKDNTFVLPGLEVKEGYKLAGWSVSGKESNYWDAETTTFGLTGLIVEDENGGYVSITANIVADTPEEPENKTLKIYWAIDNPAGAAWTAYGNSEAWTETVAWSDKDNTFVLPGLEVKEGYKLAGWSVSGKESNYWDAETTTFGLTGLIVEDENGGYVSITANIVADAPEELNYTVTFDSKGGTAVPAQTVKEGEKATEPDDPTRSGYIFQGWYLNGEKYDFNTPVTADITLTAQWAEKESGGSTVTPREYTLRYETNGGSKIASTTHRYGKVVQLTKTPIREGYTFTGWYANKQLTKKITEIKMTEDKTVYAGWEKTDVPSDLNGDDHFAYIIGRDDGLVHPADRITREEVATIFFRLLNADTREENLSDSNIFPDVDDDRWSNTAISTLADLGILEGYTDGTFGPARPITRAEFATISARFSSKEYSGDSLFDDIEGHWAENYINRAATVGWIMGDNGSFRPNDYITRAEAMTLINRVLSRLPQSVEDLHDDMIVWPDNQDESKWYYLAVQEATNSHDFEIVKGDEVWTDINKVPDWTVYEQ